MAGVAVLELQLPLLGVVLDGVLELRFRLRSAALFPGFDGGSVACVQKAGGGGAGRLLRGEAVGWRWICGSGPRSGADGAWGQAPADFGQPSQDPARRSWWQMRLSTPLGKELLRSVVECSGRSRSSSSLAVELARAGGSGG